MRNAQAVIGSTLQENFYRGNIIIKSKKIGEPIFTSYRQTP